VEQDPTHKALIEDSGTISITSPGEVHLLLILGIVADTVDKSIHRHKENSEQENINSSLHLKLLKVFPLLVGELKYKKTQIPSNENKTVVMIGAEMD
jgi:hypothetical protein